MMIRPKARRRPWLLISSATIFTLAVLTGAVFFLLPKIVATHANQSTGSTGNSAQTLNSTNNTSNANPTNKASNTNTAVQVKVQPTQAVPTMTAQGSNATTTDNGNTMQSTPATGTNNGAPQTATVPVVTLKQYVPDIRHMVAQQLNITDKALAQQLQNGMHLKDIAMQHGLSDMQLQNVLSNSITAGFQPAVSAESLTQMQVSSFIQHTQLNPTTLEQQLSVLPAPVAHW